MTPAEEMVQRLSPETIVERLRTFGRGALLEKDAADLIESLSRRVAELEAQLKASTAVDHAAVDAMDALLRKTDALLRVYHEALEIIAGKRQCADNLMGNVDVAREALQRKEGQ